MDREQIKKALECCTRGRKNKNDRPCDDCSYNECNIVGGTSERQTTGTCQGWLMKDALSLIKELTQANEQLSESYDHLEKTKDELLSERARLTEENERLRAQNETLEIKNKDFKYRIYELSRDNEEWEHENKDLECDNDMLRERITEIKADTVRKMQERLCEGRVSNDPVVIATNVVAKEMLEGK